MTSTIRTIAVLAAALAFAPAPAAAQAVDLQTILTEIRSLRIELLREKIERSEARIAEMQRTIQDVERQRTQGGDTQRSQAQEIADIEQRLAQSAVSGDDRAELETYRNQLMTAGVARVANHISSLTKQEAELRDRLNQEMRARNQLIQTVRALGGEHRM
jgi:hypothetical protein